MVLDTGAGISVVSGNFANSYNLTVKKWDGPGVTVMNREELKIPAACVVTVDVLSMTLSIYCDIVENFPYDALLLVNYLEKTPFAINFKFYLLAI